MTNTNHNADLQTFGISLHRAILDNLLGEIDSAIADGRIRSQDGMHSVLDFMRVVMSVKSERFVWNRFKLNDPECVTFCDSLTFSRKSGKRGTELTPVTDLTGLIYIAYMGTGDYSQKLRKSSASLFANEYRSRVTAPVPPTPEVAALESAFRQAKEDHRNFPHSIESLQKVSGIVSKYQVKKAIARDFVLGRDYTEIEGDIFASDDTFYILVLSFKSNRGTDIALLPASITIATKQYFQYQENRKINRRTGQKTDPNQLELNFSLF